MNVNNILGNRQGSVTILAIGVMVFLGILLSGVLPMITQEVRSGTMNRDVIEAQYAAEAGIKRVIVALEEKQTDWNDWIGKEKNFADKEKTYNVNSLTSVIKPSGNCKVGETYKTLPTDGTAAVAGWYCLSSEGNVKDAKKTVYFAYNYTGGTGGTGGIGETVWTPPPATDADYQNTIKFAALADGALTAWSDTGTSNADYGPSYGLGSTKNLGSNVQVAATGNVTGVDLKLLEATFFKRSNYEPLQENQVPLNFWDTSLFRAGKFYVNGNLQFNMNTPLVTQNSEQAFYYVKGNVNISAPLNGNFVIIAEGDIQLNAKCSGFIQLYSKQDMKIFNSVDGYGVFMSLKDLTVTQGTYNKAFMFGDNKVTLSGAIITGAVYSRGPLTLNGGSFVTYDASAIPQSAK